MSGFVSFVSAGPGDPELLTLKAAARLGTADVVLYDDLASGAILDHAREGARLVSVGKRAGRPSARQEHVSRLLVEYAATGAAEAAAQGKEILRNSAAQVRESLSHTTDQAAQYVQAQPLKSLLMAAAAGAAIAMLAGTVGKRHGHS